MPPECSLATLNASLSDDLLEFISNTIDFG